MRKLSLVLITAILFTNITNIHAKKYSDKTYLATRDQLTNLPMQQTLWHRDLYRRPNAKYNGSVQLTPFYQESVNKTDIGQYFGFDWDGCPRNIENIISVVYDDATKVKDSRHIIHDYNNVTPEENRLKASYKMEPYQTVYGLRIDYQQDLDRIVDGLYFRISTPIAFVKNKINLTCLEAETKQPLSVNGAIPAEDNRKYVSFLNYLSGCVENTDSRDLQARLKYAKIDGKSHSSSGFADVDARIGYKFLYKRRARAGISASMTIPTGKTPKGEWLFEPVHGNGHHWGIGAGFDGSVTLWRKGTNSVEIMLVADYKYLFQGTEKRTLDYIEVNPNLTFCQTVCPDNPCETTCSSAFPIIKPKAGYYTLGGENGKKGVFPLANVLTQDVRVTPGSMFDGILNIAFNWGNFTIDAGYNFYAKEEEQVSLRCPWKNDTYAVAAVDYNSDNDFSVLVNPEVPPAPKYSSAYAYDGAADGTNASIQYENLDFDTIRTPNAITHKVYGAIGYQWNKFDNPIMLGVGFSYEMVQRNSALEGWAGWAKCGIYW